jgi:hypothetical protein
LRRGKRAPTTWPRAARCGAEAGLPAGCRRFQRGGSTAISPLPCAAFGEAAGLLAQAVKPRPQPPWRCSRLKAEGHRQCEELVDERLERSRSPWCWWWITRPGSSACWAECWKARTRCASRAGRRALRLALQEPHPDLVLLDVLMPDMGTRCWRR